MEIVARDAVPYFELSPSVRASSTRTKWRTYYMVEVSNVFRYHQAFVRLYTA